MPISELKTVTNGEVIQFRTSGLEIYPKEDAKKTVPPVLILFAGFPDTTKTWSRLAPHFESTHHIIHIAMPDYESGNLRRFWGYDYSEIIADLGGIITHYRQVYGSKVIDLVGHDWGAVMTLQFVEQFPDQVTKFVLLDIGTSGSKRDEIGIKDVTNLILIMMYQSLFAMVFLVSRVVGNLASVLLILYPWTLLGPCPYETEVPFEAAQVKAYMCYPYVRFVSTILTSGRNVFKANFPTVPTLFCYGKKKRCVFHTASFLKQLEETDGCSYREFDCGHYLHWVATDELAVTMKEFLLDGKKNK